MENFKNLGLCEDVLKVVSAKKFEKPSEIQEKTIPLILEGKDIIAGSATGSGKTLAFAAGIIKGVEKKGKIQALVLTPTRELAEQVSCSIEEFSYHKGLEVVPIYGGVSMVNQVKKLTYADIVIATPGRLLDHLGRNSVDLNNVGFLVLDEADRMWDMGFKDDVAKIVKSCPIKRQTLLFSATISSELADFSGKYMKSPVEISVDSYVDASKLKQIYYDVPDNGKFSLLVHLLKNEDSHLVMIFCNTRRNVDFVVKNLKEQGIVAQAIHGGMNQSKRSLVMKKFDSSKVNVLVCTDVAGRGLDIEGVSHVYNYDIAGDAKDYIHRIGRTARAGKEGIAISILASKDYNNFANVQKYNPEVIITNMGTPKFKKVFVKIDRDSSYRSGGSGRRGRVSGRGGSFGGSRRREGRGRFAERENGRTSKGPRRDAGKSRFWKGNNERDSEGDSGRRSFGKDYKGKRSNNRQRENLTGRNKRSNRPRKFN